MNTDEQKERGLFEAWCRTKFPLCQFEFRVTNDGGYAAGEVHRMWQGWNARATEGDRQQRAAPVSVDADFDALLEQYFNAAASYGATAGTMGSAAAKADLTLSREALRAYVNTLHHPNLNTTSSPALSEVVEGLDEFIRREFLPVDAEGKGTLLAVRGDRLRELLAGKVLVDASAHPAQPDQVGAAECVCSIGEGTPDDKACAHFTQTADDAGDLDGLWCRSLVRGTDAADWRNQCGHSRACHGGSNHG